MDLGLRGRVALVAASSQGLGRAIADELAAEGASLVLCARGKAVDDVLDDSRVGGVTVAGPDDEGGVGLREGCFEIRYGFEANIAAPTFRFLDGGRG